MSLQEHVVAVMVRGGFSLASIGCEERTTAARILKASLMPEAAAEIRLKRFGLVGLMHQASPGGKRFPLGPCDPCSSQGAAQGNRSPAQVVSQFGGKHGVRQASRS